jgi:general L-amino acid transport system substrate-binding protein
MCSLLRIGSLARFNERGALTGRGFMTRAIAFAAATALIFGMAAGIAEGQNSTLATVKQRGFLNCGVNSALPGFSQTDGKGNWQGFDVDYCKAIAAAVLADPTKVNYVPVPRLERFSSLQSGDIDVLVRNTTWTSTRDSSGMSFVAVTYYDGQGFMVKASRGIKSVKDFASGITVCVGTGTTSELNLVDYFAARNVMYRPIAFANHRETVDAYLADRCDVYSADASSLYSVRVQQVRLKDHIVLPEIISKEPLGPAVRRDDAHWFATVRWAHFALVSAEELGVTEENVEQMATSRNPAIKRLLGSEGEFGKTLGLDDNFAFRMVKAVGNYGEIFERNLGTGSRLKIDRGSNKLWSDGGLQYAPPIR